MSFIFFFRSALKNFFIVGLPEQESFYNFNLFRFVILHTDRSPRHIPRIEERRSGVREVDRNGREGGRGEAEAEGHHLREFGERGEIHSDRVKLTLSRSKFEWGSVDSAVKNFNSC